MSGPNGIHPNALRGAALLGKSVVRIQLAAGIIVELDEPDPNLIDPRQPASLQMLVAMIRAVAANYQQQGAHDNALQSLVHTVAWLVRRVEQLEARSIIALPEDSHESFVAVSRNNITSGSDQLREAWEQQQKSEQPEQQGEPS